MAEDWWKDATVRARKVEGGYESIFDWDNEELVVNFIPFDVTAVILEEELGRKPTPEEVEEEARKLADDPMVALEALPPLPPRWLDEAEIAKNWERVRKFLGMPDLERKIAEIKKQREKEGIRD